MEYLLDTRDTRIFITVQLLTEEVQETRNLKNQNLKTKIIFWIDNNSSHNH